MTYYMSGLCFLVGPMVEEIVQPPVWVKVTGAADEQTPTCGCFGGTT